MWLQFYQRPDPFFRKRQEPWNRVLEGSVWFCFYVLGPVVTSWPLTCCWRPWTSLWGSPKVTATLITIIRTSQRCSVDLRSGPEPGRFCWHVSLIHVFRLKVPQRSADVEALIIDRLFWTGSVWFWRGQMTEPGSPRLTLVSTATGQHEVRGQAAGERAYLTLWGSAPFWPLTCKTTGRFMFTDRDKLNSWSTIKQLKLFIITITHK